MNNQFEITIDERKRIASEAVLNKKSGQYIIDIEKEVKRIQDQRKKEGLSMAITILPINANEYKEPNRSITIVKDKTYGVIYGIPIGEYPDGNIRWKKIMLGENMDLNLSNPEDCKAYIIFRMHPYFKGSPIIGERDAEYTIFDINAEADRKTHLFNDTKKAIARAEELIGERLVKFARLLGFVLEEDITVNIIRSQVYQYAIENAIDFNQKWDSTSRAVDEMFATALSLNVIRQHSEKGFLYEGMPLGIYEHEAKKYLLANGDVYASIVSASNEKDTIVKNIKEEEKKESKPKETTKKADSKTITSKKKVEEEEIDEEKEKLEEPNEDDFS